MTLAYLQALDLKLMVVCRLEKVCRDIRFSII